MNRVAILQPNFLPWKGVFDMISQVDTFIFLDDAQYTTRDWRNRNRLQTSSGPQWFTVPVRGSQSMKIFNVHISENAQWRTDHINLFRTNYKHAPYFEEYSWLLSEIYAEREWASIAELDVFSTKLICEVLGLRSCEFVMSSSLGAGGTKSERLIELIHAVGGTSYLSGPAAKSYIDAQLFEENNIDLRYIEYGYPAYKQCFEPFEHGVTILDLIFNCGHESRDYIRNIRER